jgi:hypothetical protein
MQPVIRGQRIYWGIALIVIGALLLIQQITALQVPGWVFLGLVGLMFAIGYAQTRSHGWLIPACILFGLAAGIAVESDALHGGGVLGGLGLGFIAIPVVDWIVTRRVTFWAFVPGAILLLIAILLGTGNTALLASLNWLWPVVPILLGAWVLYRYWREGPGQSGRPT